MAFPPRVPHLQHVVINQAAREEIAWRKGLPSILVPNLFDFEHPPGEPDGWAADLAPPPLGCTYFNFTASHDGIGVRPLEGLLPESEFDALVAAVEQRGGLVSRRSNPDGSTTPYELNITYFDAVGVPGDLDASIARCLCAHTIALSLQGVPGIYFNSLLDACNNLAGVEQTGRARTINRKKWTECELAAVLDPTAGHQASRLLPEYLRRLNLRRRRAAFHPDAPQRVLDLPAKLTLAPYQVVWLVTADAPGDER